MKRFFLYVLFGCFSPALHAQVSISGTLVDSVDNSPLIGVSVLLRHKQDSAYVRGTVTDATGKFTFQKIKTGEYTLRFTSVGYKTIFQVVMVNSPNLQLPPIRMAIAATTLRALEVRGQAIPVDQKGDTLQYNANAFKTEKNATAEELITKMPGITFDNAGVKAQGETVRQVLVDGKRFFGDDAAVALKNLPAEIIEKIEVFDRLSEQSQFTGFDDGQSQRTINIVTKKGMNNGQFGKITGGISDNGRYLTSGSVNAFKGNRKLTILGMSNNINQQNFTNEDLTGITGGNNRGGNGRNFQVGQQKGIATTHAGGLNYNNEWGKNLEVSSSYFYNGSDNDRYTTLSRQFIARDSGLLYVENNKSSTLNQNHRLNARIEYKVDTANSLVFSPRLSFQNNSSDATSTSNSSIENEMVSQLNKSNNGDNIAYNLGGNILFRHRFSKKGRSFSWSFDAEVNNRDGNSGLYSQNEDGETIADQRTDDVNNIKKYSSNAAYTEPVGEYGQVQANYTIGVTKSNADKRTYNKSDDETGDDLLNTRLTNVFDNKYWSNRGGLNYRYNYKRKVNVMTGLNVQHARLINDQEYPDSFEAERDFFNLLPQASINLKSSNGQTLRIEYKSATNAPSISQLQNVVNNSNPQFLRSGNANLKQDYQQNVSVRFNRTNAESGRSFMFFIYGAYIQDYIGNATYFNDATDSIVVNDVKLAPNQQITYPVNVTENWNARTLLTWSAPIAFIKSNFNLNSGLNYNRTPAKINDQINLSHNYNLNQGIAISSNISKKIDFTFSYTANYTIVRNTLSENANNNYFTHLSSLKFKIQPWKGLVLSSDLTNSLYKGLSADLDQDVWFWNAYIGYKLLKNEGIEIKVSGFDLLNQNTSINRDVTDTYIEDSRTTVLTRYLMLGVSYNFRRS